jgi:hypothetical protein
MTELTSAQELFKDRHFDQEIIVRAMVWVPSSNGRRNTDFVSFSQAQRKIEDARPQMNVLMATKSGRPDIRMQNAGIRPRRPAIGTADAGNA